jgi:hypothetical protein
VSTFWTVKFAEWVTGVVPSAPRVTVQVVPLTLVTIIFSELAAGSATRKNVGGEAAELAAGNPLEEETVHVWEVPAAGAVVPPLLTVVCSWLANSSRPAIGILRDLGRHSFRAIR